jgi:Mrp family chromosome partitioning ATPase
MAAITDLPAELMRGRPDTQSGGGLPDRTMMLNISDLEMQASSRPMEEVRQPPEINLTEHHLRTDVQHDPRLIMLHDPDSERSACFRILRHHLMDHGRPQVIVVSSANAGDGKTTCAVNLALALAECGRARVLLVEATVRSPQLARIFELTPPWCFAEQLTAHRQQPLLPWSAVHVPAMFLHVAAMHPNLEQRQLLDAPAFAIAMERLRLGKYDHIVVDAPAVIGSAEVNLLQDAADGVILVARAKKTTARSMRQAVEQLSPTKIIGSVLMQ